MGEEVHSSDSLFLQSQKERIFPLSLSLSSTPSSLFTDLGGFIGGILGGEARRPDMLRGPMMSAREALRRELEKDRIREEILAREILRRRELEEEVRREMAFEREIALRRQADRFSLAPSSASLPRQASPRLLELRSGERAAVVSPRNVAEDISTAENGSRRRISEVKEEADASLVRQTSNILLLLLFLFSSLSFYFAVVVLRVKSNACALL